jgi:hypothetical protein
VSSADVIVRFFATGWLCGCVLLLLCGCVLLLLTAINRNRFTVSGQAA